MIDCPAIVLDWASTIRQICDAHGLGDDRESTDGGRSTARAAVDDIMPPMSLSVCLMTAAPASRVAVIQPRGLG
jgi:hypothetical protein